MTQREQEQLAEMLEDAEQLHLSIVAGEFLRFCGLIFLSCSLLWGGFLHFLRLFLGFDASTIKTIKVLILFIYCVVGFVFYGRQRGLTRDEFIFGTMAGFAWLLILD